MYDIAREFDLPGAERYISACVCACAEGAGWVKGTSVDRGIMANELVTLACNVWMADILSICEQLRLMVLLILGSANVVLSIEVFWTRL